MKHQKLSFLFFFLLLGLGAQGNLQFNQVINLIPGNTYTVPLGKVLKVESITSHNAVITTALQGQISCVQTTCTCAYQSQAYLNLGNITYAAQPANLTVNGSCSTLAPSNSSNVTFPALSLPIWLKEGTQVAVQNNITGILVTGIEFNVIP